MRLKVSHLLALVVIAALSVGLMAGPASAKMSAKQKAHIRAKLRKQVKKNPAVIKRKSFVKKAALVNFRLPVTIALRGGNTATNPNAASIDLGPSLGSREIDLGGSLAAEIIFHDSFDGGALGNVDVDIRPSTSKFLQSTSIPLLWNDDVSTVPFGSGGCQGYNGGTPIAFDPIYVPDATPGVAPHTAGAVLNPAPFDGSVFGSPGFPTVPGVDSIALLTNSKAVGIANNLGGNPQPFPVSGPQVSNLANTVLRTAPLDLSVAEPGTPVPGLVPDNGSTSNDGTQANPPVQNSQDVVIGRSGGQANLFGNIPGKSYGLDVTVSLATKIHSIIRQVDSIHENLVTGDNWPASALECRQAYTGYVQNYIPGVRLQGSLKIAPAIMPNGSLRIAKATISSGAEEKTNVALAACLFPDGTYANVANGSQTAPGVTVPTPPIDPGTPRGVPANKQCNDTPEYYATQAGVAPLTAADTTAAGGYTVGNDGSRAVVSGLLSVDNVTADILIGDV
jgi:hypothetical protein